MAVSEPARNGAVSGERLPYRSVLVTGASGYVGRQLITALAANRRDVETIIATDVRLPETSERVGGTIYARADVRSDDLAATFERHQVELVVHLAAIVTPGQRSNRALEYEVDVVGTENVLRACFASGVRKLIYTSSGAAYGYHADNPAWLDETAALRGNPEFAYSDHKRRVEELLARARAEHPELLQLVFRPGTILGSAARNQITDLLDRPYVLGLQGSESPFVFVWDQDVVGAILHGVHDGGTGIFNLAGDGMLTVREIAAIAGKPLVVLPVRIITAALWVLQKLGLTQYGPEQVRFLRYRPVLSNRRVKEEFGYAPRKTTREAFEDYLRARRGAGDRGPKGTRAPSGGM